MPAVLDTAATVVLAGPPTSPQPIDADAWTRFVQLAGYVKWACIITAIAGLMTIGTLLMVDNRLVDQFGPSIQAILIKVIAGCVVLAVSAQLAELFT